MFQLLEKALYLLSQLFYMSMNKWGPPVWMFLHTLAEKIKEDEFSKIAPSLFTLIRTVCNNLPCPECSMHAKLFLSKIDFAKIKTKDDLKRILYIFHNAVNKRKNKPAFNINYIARYSTSNLAIAYNNFVAAYKTNGNMKLLADNFQRKIVIKNINSWLSRNHQLFLP
jgi:hypothetical protein